MNGKTDKSRNWLTLLVSIIAISLVAVLGVLIWNSQAAAPDEPLPAEAFVQLNPSTGEPGTIVTLGGHGWQQGETVLVYLVEVENGSTDGIVYGSAVADSNGQMTTSFRYPQAGPWTAKQEAIVLVRGVTSGRTARAAFQVIQPIATSTAQPDTPTPEPTATPVPDTPIPATDTPVPAPPTPTPTPVPPTPTPIPPMPILPAPTPTPVRITEWRGEYYNNVNLSGSPLVRNDTKVDFDWGKGSPAKGIGADHFSARWTRRLDFEGKTYRFNVRVDDGVRLWVDGQLLIDQWQDGAMRAYSVERGMTPGKHDVRVEMYERTERAAITFWRETVESYPDWKGEYFGNSGLNGAPILVRNDKGIDFNWGEGAPAPGLPADNFGVRWTRQLHYSAGHYRFTVEIDDGVRLWVDGILIIDRWHDGVGSYSGDIYLVEGWHRVQMEMYEHTGGAMARLWWARQEGFPEWKGEYFANHRLAGEPALVRNDTNVDFNWGAGAPAAGLPADDFGVRWTRQLHYSAGHYRFTVEVDDGVRLWVDNQLLIDQWHDGIGSYSGDVYLVEGKHQVRMEMYEHTGGAMARLWWTLQPNIFHWRGQYYSNPDLQGESVLVRDDQEINFRWKKGAPAAGLPIDGFSVRWMRNVDFEFGIYRFCATADDGVRVSIDGGAPFIDEWHDSSGSTYCKDVQMVQGRHKIEVEYYDNMERALIKFWWGRLADG